LGELGVLGVGQGWVDNGDKIDNDFVIVVVSFVIVNSYEWLLILYNCNMVAEFFLNLHALDTSFS